jgi:hypothetical protein
MTSQLDGPGVELDLGGSLSLSIGALSASLDADRRDRAAQRAAAQRRIPVHRPLSASGVGVTSTTLYLGLGHPDPGFIWEIRRIVVGGALATATPASTAVMAIVGPPNPTDLTLTNAFDYTTVALPWVAYYSTAQFVVQQGQHLTIAITGPGNTTPYAAAVTALQYPVEAFGDVYQL